METVGAAQNTANSMMAMYHIVDNVSKAQLALDRANLRVSNSLDTVAKAQSTYNDALTKFGANSPQADQALKDLKDSQEKLRIEQETATDKQNTLNERMIFGAVTVIPQAIAMITNLKAMYVALTAGSVAHTAQLGLETTAQTALNTARIAGILGPVALIAGGLIAGGLAGQAMYESQIESMKAGGASEEDIAYMMSRPKSKTGPGYGTGGIAGLNGPEKVIVGEYGPEFIIPARKGQPLGLIPASSGWYPTSGMGGGAGIKAQQAEEVAAQQAYTSSVDKAFAQLDAYIASSGSNAGVPAKKKAATKMAAMAYAGNDLYGPPPPTQSGRGDIIIKEVNVTIRDVSIDAATYTRFKRDMAYSIATQVCDAVNEQRDL
jgi:hypothetical protein